MGLKVTLGSQLLTETFTKRGAKAELARRMGQRQELVARWATGARVPSEINQSWLEDHANIPARAWGDTKLAPKEFWAWVAEKEWLAVDLLAAEASAEPAPTFQVDDKSANGGSHAA